MLLSSLACVLTAFGGADDPNLPAAPVIDPVFLGEQGGYQDLELDKQVNGLEDGTVIFDSMVRLSEPIVPQDDDFAFASRFRGDKYDYGTPWVHYGAEAADIRVLSYDLTYLLARIQVEVPVGTLAGDHAMSAADWPLGSADLQVVIGEEGSLGLDAAGEPKGADSMASLSVFGDYPAVFARVEGGESAVGIQDTILVMRHEGADSAANYSLELFEADHSGLLAGTSVPVHFDALDYMFETEVLSLQEGSFRMRLLDPNGNVVFESKPAPVTGSDSFEYDSSMNMPNSGGAFVASSGPATFGLTQSGPGGTGETDPEPFNEDEVEVEFEIEEPPILLKLYARCVQGSINDNGDTHSASCGGCTTGQNPPEPNCVEGDSVIFYTSAYCKSRPWYLTTCTSDGSGEKQGPTYRFVGKSKPTTQGCTQVGVSISVKISEIFGGGASVSKPRRRVCCEYERNENETGKANMRKCKHN